MLWTQSRRCFLALGGAWVAGAGEQLPRTIGGWKKRRQRILAAMQEVMGPLPELPRTPPRIETVESFEESGFLRKKIRYEAEAGDWVPAWLLMPNEVQGARRARAGVC